MKKYTVDYFIRKFSRIPEENWICGLSYRGSEQNCALGHCGSSTSPSNPEAKALTKIINRVCRLSAWEINDCSDETYLAVKQHGPVYALGENPKQRILAVLELAKAGVKL